MYQQYLRIILVLLLINDIKSDVRELKIHERGYLPPIKKGDDQELKVHEREYLPPDKNSGEIKEIGLKGAKYLPPAEPDSKEDLPLKDTLLLPPEKSHYIHNKPKVIDDPLPKRIDYKQPLSLDFLTGQYKPTFEGGLISGLFVNENQIQKFNSETSKELKHNKNVKMFLIKSNPSKLNTKVDYILKPLKSEFKAESSNRNYKYVKIVDDSDEIVPINHYEDKDMIYILFNYDDDAELSASAPVVIYKPGDDLAFTEDTTVIDNYEHVFPMEILSGNKTTTTTTPKTIITTRTTSTTTTTTTTPETPQEPRSFKVSYSKEEKGNRSSSKESKSDLSRNRSSSEENKNRSHSNANNSDHSKNRSSEEDNKSDVSKNRFSSERNRSDSFKNRSSSEEKEKETENDHSQDRSSSEETESDHSKQRSSSEESKSNNSKNQSSSKETESDHSKHQISSEEKSESDHSDHQSSKHGGYIYEKPKIPFTF